MALARARASRAETARPGRYVEWRVNLPASNGPAGRQPCCFATVWIVSHKRNFSFTVSVPRRSAIMSSRMLAGGWRINSPGGRAPA
jgi:hypothetical protein